MMMHKTAKRVSGIFVYTYMYYSNRILHTNQLIKYLQIHMGNKQKWKINLSSSFIFLSEVVLFLVLLVISERISSVHTSVLLSKEVIIDRFDRKIFLINMH